MSVVSQSQCNAFAGGAVTLTLTLQFDGDGSGHVGIAPIGATCHDDCAVELPYAMTAQVQAYPDADSIAVSCRNACNFNMVTGHSQTIRFLRKGTVGAIIQSITALHAGGDGPEIFEDGFEVGGL